MLFDLFVSESKFFDSFILKKYRGKFPLPGSNLMPFALFVSELKFFLLLFLSRKRSYAHTRRSPPRARTTAQAAVRLRSAAMSSMARSMADRAWSS